ncbi:MULTISPECIES: cytochrome c oxidase subunit 3 [Modicisalibacter]|uniref:cytochrome c oxidase subunit 3 n=1 Tax=Modicisalibacter TaxID=574347 RepID=UPI00100BDD11|nr:MULTISPECIES: cytochrome c oxidase subunit 3 [Halomonadaceae]MBZ9558092.1 cytochrome c oxidase subunit 3 [Modicisalibacter sp. R2A 31.J]MBZ9573239.1 cytochrome c oxidase subunit 3 [Modicisalibacter sp. MOD 31.J]
MTTPSRHPGLNLGRAHPEAHHACEGLVFGFWVFMMSDLIIFGLLFANYVTQLDALAGGPGPKDLFEMKSAFIETMLLLTSSFTYGMAAYCLKYRNGRGALLFWLVVTLALGLSFIGFELHDFRVTIDKGGAPSQSGFASAFFGLVPLHGLHVATACLWMIVLIVQMLVYGLDTGVKTGLVRLGLLWHFLDIVWIGIFSLVYLGGLA